MLISLYTIGEVTWSKGPKEVKDGDTEGASKEYFRQRGTCGSLSVRFGPGG